LRHRAATGSERRNEQLCGAVDSRVVIEPAGWGCSAGCLAAASVCSGRCVSRRRRCRSDAGAGARVGNDRSSRHLAARLRDALLGCVLSHFYDGSPETGLVGVARDAVDEAQMRVVRLASLRHDRHISAAQVHVVEVWVLPFMVGRLGGAVPASANLAIEVKPRISAQLAGNHRTGGLVHVNATLSGAKLAGTAR
jgi:hypothetical protein